MQPVSEVCVEVERVCVSVRERAHVYVCVCVRARARQWHLEITICSIGLLRHKRL